MLPRNQAEEIVGALTALPPEKVTEVHDFIVFLKQRSGYEKPTDESEAWSDDDIRDLTNAVLNYADQSL